MHSPVPPGWMHHLSLASLPPRPPSVLPLRGWLCCLSAQLCCLSVCPALPSTACTNHSLPAAPVPGSARHLHAKQRLSAVREGNLPQKVSQAAAVLQVGRCVRGHCTLLPAHIQHSSPRITVQVTSKSLASHQATWACKGFLKNAMRSKKLISSGRGTAYVTASPHTEVCVSILR